VAWQHVAGTRSSCLPGLCHCVDSAFVMIASNNATAVLPSAGIRLGSCRQGNVERASSEVDKRALIFHLLLVPALSDYLRLLLLVL
jgi:hypothetical protein